VYEFPPPGGIVITRVCRSVHYPCCVISQKTPVRFSLNLSPMFNITVNYCEVRVKVQGQNHHTDGSDSLVTWRYINLI